MQLGHGRLTLATNWPLVAPRRGVRRGWPPAQPVRAFAIAAPAAYSAWVSASVGLGAWAALALERTALGRKVTSPLLSFFFGWALKALGLLRDAQSAERLASSLLPAALPLMVLSAQTAEGGSSGNEIWSVLGAFAVCTLASCGAAVAAFALSHAGNAGWAPVAGLAALSAPTAAKICGALAATYIGGSANLAEVAWSSGLAQDQRLLGCLAAADVVLMGIYFAGLTMVANWAAPAQSPTPASVDTAPASRAKQLG
ncbi:unnamed protein product, partial [Effrenium voratum]